MKTANVVVTEDSTACGGVVWWLLSGLTDWGQLGQLWQAAGLAADLLPSVVSPDAALTRAMADLRAQHRLVRRLPDKSGWAVVEEIAVPGNDLDYSVGLKVKLDAGDQLEFPPDARQNDVDLVRAAHLRYLSAMTTTDVSQWLVKLADGMGAVQLRRGGGIYFVPQKHMDTWRRYAAVVEKASNHQVWCIPAMRTNEAVKAVLAAVAAEAEAGAEKLEQVLGDGSCGAVALANRADEVGGIKAKVTAYEELLGVSLDALRERLDRLRASLAAAALVAQTSDTDSKEAA